MAEYPSTRDTGTRSPRRLALLILLCGFLLIVIWLGIKVWRLVDIARALPAYEERFAALAEDGLANADPDETEALVLELRADVVTLRREVRPLLPLARLFTWAPKVGPLFAEAGPLLEIADSGTEAAAYAIRGLKPLLAAVQQPDPTTSTVARAVPILAAAKPDLQRAATALDRTVAARAQIEEPEALPWRVQTTLAQMDDKLYLADMLDLLVVAPELLGADGPRHYLIVAQNEDEVRATGGFISGAGLLVVDGGQIRSLDFQDASLIDAWGNSFSLTKPYEVAPEPLWTLMGVQLMLFRDANYWPDFPISAQKLMALYEYGQDYPALDGVIAIDQHFLQLLLNSTGPLEVGELEMTVSASNVVEGLRAAWQSDDEDETAGDWVRSRKDFLGPMASAIMEKLLNDLASLDPLYLTANVSEALEQKHLQIYVSDPAVAEALERTGWSNRVSAAPGQDALMLVDHNAGFNKVAPYIASSLHYELLLDASGGGEALVTATYTHTLQEELDCRQGGRASYADKPAYEDLTHDCFWNYLRLYVPAESTLLDATRHPYDASLFTFSEGWTGEPVSQSDLDGLSLFQNFFILKPGETIQSVYRYNVGPVTRQEDGANVYELRLFRQAGPAPRYYTVDLTLPPGSRLLDAIPAPAAVTGTRLHFAGELVTDLTIRVAYE